MRSASTPLGGEFSASSGVLAENSGHSGRFSVFQVIHMYCRDMLVAFAATMVLYYGCVDGGDIGVNDGVVE